MSDVINQNFIRYSGYTGQSSGCGEKDFFSPKTVEMISDKVSQLLEGLDPYHRKIIVTNNNITNIMNSVFQNYTPHVGDIHSRYIIPQDTQYSMWLQDMIDRVIEVLVSGVQAQYGMEMTNSKLSIWTTVLGEGNAHGLRMHAPIKLRERRPNPYMFNMNY